MPLSLRRPKRKPNTLLTPDTPSRSVSTPTLLSRLRSSTFSRSKVSLASLAYDLVRARTPPTPYEVATPFTSPRRGMEERKVGNWDEQDYRLTKEQRECLAGAECLGIWDPITGEKESPNLLKHPIFDQDILDDISEIESNSDDTEVSTSTPTPDSSILLPSLALKRDMPNSAKSQDIVSPPSTYPQGRPPTAPFTPYRKITLRSRIRLARLDSAGGSPVMVPLRPESPDTRPHTPTKNDDGPEWTTVSVPQTPLAKMKLQSYQ